MCGIVGYVGERKAIPILLQGLKKVEYRGYDSAGIALIDAGEIVFCKQAGKIVKLKKKMRKDGFFNHASTIGIAHTRWATHGNPTDVNAHPHLSCERQKVCKGKVAVVHNGIIENFSILKEMLLERGHQFKSQTDTEIFAHLIAEYLNGDPLEAVRSALMDIKGTYGLAVLFNDYPDKIFFARKGSPLLIGVGDGESFVASDASSFRKYTDKQIILEDDQIGFIKRNGYKVMKMNKVAISPKVERIEWELKQIGKAGYSHFMLKEICEQPKSLQDSMRGRILPDHEIKLGGLAKHHKLLKSLKSIFFVAAGTSLHAGMIGKILIQEISKIPAQAESASELANQKFPIFPKKSVAWAISQSGETADLLQAIREMKGKLKLPILGLCNVVGSSVARETEAGVYIHAGPEIGVASTKAFTSQVLDLHLISLYLRELRKIRKESWMEKYIKDLKNAPLLVEKILERKEEIRDLAWQYAKYKNFLFLGRGINYPVALEGALKLKEISYRHAEGYPSGEMKHGPLALINKNFPTVFIVPKNDDYYDKIISNILEIKARQGSVIAIANEGDKKIKKYVDDVIYIPSITYYLTPLLFVIPLQLFAYYVAVKLRRNVDQPRNLAKSVTVE